MEKLFLPYELALKLKEMGFDKSCFGSYSQKETLLYFGINSYKNSDGLLTAPLYQQAFTWLFQKLDFYYPYLSIVIFSDGSGYWNQPKDEGNDELNIDFDNLDEAIEKALESINS